MTMPQREQRYTYSDYYTWDDGKRWELIDGIAYAMSPSPSFGHQTISGELFLQLASFLKGKPCKVFHAPFDVRLNADAEDDTVVQPDIFVVCDRAKIDDKGCKGAPDMVIEILSPSTAKRDIMVKFNAYKRAGVREYWVVDPDNNTVSAHVLENGKYVTSVYGEEDAAPAHVLEGCSINLADVFAAPPF